MGADPALDLDAVSGTCSRPPNAASDVVAARVTAAGIGLLVFMVTWLVASRIAGLIWEAPVGPVVAMVTAMATGTLVAVLRDAG
jgi:hypothetical protein